LQRCLKFIDKQDINEKNISILGCGWLGLPLAKGSIGKGISVKGSTTSPNKISILEKSEFILLIALEADRISGQSRILKAAQFSLLIFHPN
jgi:UDP-N-acetyl-D-mannosaminuronate dehydrogenase